MKVQVNDATPVQLNWLAAKITNPEWWEDGYMDGDPMAALDMDDGAAYSPSTDWSQGGPIIEREVISIVRDEGDDYWQAVTDANSSSMFGPGLCGNNFQCGPTPLIAAMRCFVASKLGDEVDVPDDLVWDELIYDKGDE